MAGIHDKLSRVRKPRVHISYDVEEDGATIKRELPFVVGVMGDFSGNPTREMKSLKDRAFVPIDRDNFGEVMSSIAPELNLKVKNTLKGDGSEMAVNLKFRGMEDFEPKNVVAQVEPLRKLMETRSQLVDLATKAERSEKLEDLLERVLKNSGDLKKLQSELGVQEQPKPEGGA